MRLSLRFVLPLLLVLAGIAYAVAPLVDRLTLNWFVRDLEIRATLIANTIQEPLQEQLNAGKKAKIQDFFNRITQGERLYAIGYCAVPTSTPLASRSLPAEIRCAELDRWEPPGDHLLASAQGPLHVAVRPMVKVQRDSLLSMVLLSWQSMQVTPIFWNGTSILLCTYR